MTCGTLFIVSGPSGVGKTTIATQALEILRNEYCIDRLTTYTTKQPRKLEKAGVDYHFVTREEFLSLQQQGFFIEVVELYGNFYGTAVQDIIRLREGVSLLALIDQQGGQQLSRLYEPIIGIWIDAPSFEVLSMRLRLRGTETDEQIERRLGAALQEIYCARHSPLYKYKVINDELCDSVDAFVEIIKKELGYLKKV